MCSCVQIGVSASKSIAQERKQRSLVWNTQLQCCQGRARCDAGPDSELKVMWRATRDLNLSQMLSTDNNNRRGRGQGAAFAFFAFFLSIWVTYSYSLPCLFSARNNDCEREQAKEGTWPCSPKSSNFETSHTHLKFQKETGATESATSNNVCFVARWRRW